MSIGHHLHWKQKQTQQCHRQMRLMTRVQMSHRLMCKRRWLTVLVRCAASKPDQTATQHAQGWKSHVLHAHRHVNKSMLNIYS